MVGVIGIEPMTSALSEPRSNQLSYTPKISLKVKNYYQKSIKFKAFEFYINSNENLYLFSKHQFQDARKDCNKKWWLIQLR